MRIAVDVKGTIEGPKQVSILAMIRRAQELGHEVVVWSNSFGYAVDAVKKHSLNCEPQDKKMKSDLDNDESAFFDLVIDDDMSQDWLAAKRFLWVRDIPNDDIAAVEMLEKLLLDRGL